MRRSPQPGNTANTHYSHLSFPWQSLQSVLETVTTPFAYKTPSKSSVPSLMNETPEVTMLGLCQAHDVLKANQNASVFHCYQKYTLKNGREGQRPDEFV